MGSGLSGRGGTAATFTKETPVDTDRLLHLVWDAEDDDTGRTSRILAG
jgi:hypothetical protein